MYSYFRAGKLSGAHIANGFGYIDVVAESLDFNVIRNIICQGHHQGNVVYVVRNVFTSEVSKKLIRNFDSILEETSGGSRGYDSFVLTSQVGATQFEKNTPDYIKEVIRQGENSLKLFDGVSAQEVETVFINDYLEREFAAEGINFGFSKYKCSPASYATFRRWLDNGKMSLMPHEDVAQLKRAATDQFEINSVLRVISFNACIEAPASGGELTIWNIHPDEECRSRYGVVGTGYPYDLDDLSKVAKIEIKLNSGDVYFMNASHIHGVSSLIEGRRLTAGRFIGRTRKDKVVFWT